MSESRRITLLEGDPEAIAAIRSETRSAYAASDIAEDAPVYFSNGLLVRGADSREYEVPAAVQSKYLGTPAGSQYPIARMSMEPRNARAIAEASLGLSDGDTIPHLSTDEIDEQAQQLYIGGVPAEGDPQAIAYVRNVARLYHEMPGVIFPVDGEVRWFKNGLYVVGKDEKTAFQVPMDRVTDLVVPRPHPHLPTLRMTVSARKSLQ